MAIDTAAKRRQMLGMTEETLPIPDGTISAADRALLLQIYYLVASAVTTPANRIYTVLYQNRTFTVVP